MIRPNNEIFKLPFSYNVEECRNYVNSLPRSAWLEWTERQTKYNEIDMHPHKHTESIKLKWVGHRATEINSDLITVNEPYYSKINLLLKPLFDMIEMYYGGIVYRCIIVNLPKGKMIYPHRDKDITLDIAHRVHIPLQTNSNVIFKCGDEINMKVNYIYEIDNNAVHSVENNGNSNRLHIIADIIEFKDLKKKNYA